MNDVTKTNAKRSQPGSNQNNSIKSQNEEKQNNQSQNSAAENFKNFKQQLNNASSVDSVRVAEVQSAISNGEYTVDANRIADKILAFEDFKNK